MKKALQLLLLSVSCLIFKQASAQMADPVHWSFHATKINDCEFELVIKANLDGNWHLYGQKKYGDDGPLPTTFHYSRWCWFRTA
jgi:thiol:disulfide interchange protein DsbD